MDQLGSRLKQITTDLKDYLETRIDLMVLNVSEQVTLWIGQSVQKLIGFTVVGVGLGFGMVALAIYLGQVLGNPAVGYAVIALPLLIIGLFFSTSKPRGIAKSIQNQFMTEILKALDEEKEKEMPLKLPESKNGHHQEENEHVG